MCTCETVCIQMGKNKEKVVVWCTNVGLVVQLKVGWFSQGH